MVCKDDGTSLGGDGSSASSPAINCFALLTFHNQTVSGAYWVQPKGIATAFQVFCGTLLACGTP